MNRRLAGAIAWMFALQFFVSQGVVQSAWMTPFSLAHNMISDLGRETGGLLSRAPGLDYACSPWHALMNASIILNGILIPLGVLLTRSWWPRSLAMTIALTMIALTGPGHFLVGLFPSDTGPQGHLIGAGSILALGNPGMVVAGLAAWRERWWPAIASISLGFAGIVGTLLFINEVGGGIGLGAMERIAFYPLTIWCGIQGIAIARHVSSRRPV